MFKHRAVARLRVWIILFPILHLPPNEHHLFIIIISALDSTLRFICYRRSWEWVRERVIRWCSNICSARIVHWLEIQLTTGIAPLHPGRHRRRRWLTLTVVVIGNCGTSTTIIDNHVVRRDDIIMGHIRFIFNRALTTIKLRGLHCHHGRLTVILTVRSLLPLLGLTTFALSSLQSQAHIKL